MAFKFALWVAVVGGSNEQIQNAALAGLLIILINVRIGIMPSNEAYDEDLFSVAKKCTLIPW